MRFFSRLNPAPGVRDFAQEFTRPTPYRWPVMAVAALMTGTIFYTLAGTSVSAPPAPPEITYITTYAPDRTDAEIVASNIAHQQRKDAILAAEEARQERIRDMYKALGRASGMDVDRIEREAAADRAAEARAAAARRAAIQARVGTAGSGAAAGVRDAAAASAAPAVTAADARPADPRTPAPAPTR